MRQLSRILILTGALLGACMAENDPPARVGRLNYLSGAVSFQPAGVDEWVDAAMNRPLTTGDQLWTEQGARAELHIGSAALRLGPRSAFEFLNLDDNNVQIRLAEGSLNVRLRRLDENETFEVDTPNLAFSLLRPGEYRIDVNPETYMTVVTVRGGQGEVNGGGQSFAVHPREQARVSGTDSLTYDVAGAPPPDGWDRWCMDRDHREDHSRAAEYVPRDMIGYQDLDEYGTWRVDAEYGPVWAPREVVGGWAPYRFGHWVWIEPWGWTWVDDAPWGFAPFHYGRWAFLGSGWVWVPGPVRVRPVYAPALVAWVGGPRFSVSVSFGGGAGAVAWFPLGPREVYVPAYRASPAYVTRVNTTNTVINNINVTNVRYVNQTVPGAVTAAPQTALATAQPISRVAVPIHGDALRQAQVITTAPVAPRRESVLGANAGSAGAAARPPTAVLSRPVVAKNTPPPAPVPFARRQEALAANPGHPLDSDTMQRLRVRHADNPTPRVRQPIMPSGGQAAGGQGGASGRSAFGSTSTAVGHQNTGPESTTPQERPARTFDRPQDRPRNRPERAPEPQVQPQVQQPERPQVNEPRRQRRPDAVTPNPAPQERREQRQAQPQERPEKRENREQRPARENDKRDDRKPERERP